MSTVATGSITQGTVSPNAGALDLRVSPNLSPLHHGVSPSASPGLSMIQEENTAPISPGMMADPVDSLDWLTDASSRLWSAQASRVSPFNLHPQISVTDEMGGEVTLVQSRSSCESVDSLDTNRTSPIDSIDAMDQTDDSCLGAECAAEYRLPSLIASRPCDPNQPSIVRGIGKAAAPHPPHLPMDAPLPGERPFLTRDERRESFTQSKNAALRHSFPPPSNLPAYDGSSRDSENGRTSPSYASDRLQKTASGSFQVPLADLCAQWASMDVLGLVQQLISKRGADRPGSGFVIGGVANNELTLEHAGGMQIKLRLCKGELRMRRISGDHRQYSQLCQELCHELVAQLCIT